MRVPGFGFRAPERAVIRDMPFESPEPASHVCALGHPESASDRNAGAARAVAFDGRFGRVA
ncbi:MAG TPA: hypothetical protein DHV08_11415 [Rhodocyclaceae bacterium]|nr:MAG: hypothetical protein COW56_07715 [Rhodocyclales bacterium CG17_big_fil_post_rev_8_21_14_2_50_68_7]PIX75187.1 MAG: hypothetical protein COZ38_06940 [Rhodocyclales bacterium CG_4_10_14_3_um_filter_68_10]PJA57373.1 MAG: hypothetical protein CO164_08055 [Rhodocyclales bacterium CG_4_9_14_3_um_filter_68_10]HCX34091.1 hypothetical protein [Rhodocyclaceae bacterium]